MSAGEKVVLNDDYKEFGENGKVGLGQW